MRTRQETAKALAMRSIRIDRRRVFPSGAGGDVWVVGFLVPALLPALVFDSAEEAVAAAEKLVASEVAAILAAIDEAVRSELASGMPPTSVSEGRLAEIQGWKNAEYRRGDEGSIHAPDDVLILGSASSVPAIVVPESSIQGRHGIATLAHGFLDLLAHIDALESRMRDMAQDDVGIAWKAGYAEGFAAGAMAQRKTDAQAVEELPSTHIPSGGWGAAINAIADTSLASPTAGAS